MQPTRRAETGTRPAPYVTITDVDAAAKGALANFFWGLKLDGKAI